MHAHRVLGDGSWTRGPCPKSTKGARNKQAGVHGFELPLERAAQQEMAALHARCLFSHRVRAFSSARSGSAQRRRCEIADLSPGFSTRIPAWPVLQTRLKSRSEFHRRIGKRDEPLVCEQARRLRGQTQAESVDHLPVQVDCRLHVQAASHSRLQFPYLRTETQPEASLFLSLLKHVAPRERLFPHAFFGDSRSPNSELS